MRRDGPPEPRNFRDWIRWRMGGGIAECFMVPYNEKLWCSDLRDVSTSWVSGRVPEAPLDDVLKSALGIPTEGYTHQLRFYYPRRGGSRPAASSGPTRSSSCARPPSATPTPSAAAPQPKRRIDAPCLRSRTSTVDS
jgi:hypothetical protein